MRKAFWLALGLVSLGLGVAGVVLPLVPTTPLVLLAAYCFAKSSGRLHRWLTTHRLFGPLIRDYQLGLGIPMRAKIWAVSLIVVTMAVSLVAVEAKAPRIVLPIIGAGVIVFILTRPTRRHPLEQNSGKNGDSP